MWLSIMQSLFQSDGAHVEILHAKEHDEIMEEAARHYGETNEALERSDREINAWIGEKGK
jgi:hypothetical protein